MIAYLLNSTLCLLALFLFYQVFLAKEKMYRFNRFYLLIALVLGLLLPAQDFTWSPKSLIKAPDETIAGMEAGTLVAIKKAPMKALSGSLFSMDHKAESVQQNTKQDLPLTVPASNYDLVVNILLFIYLAGALFFFVRYLSGIYAIYKKAWQQEKVTMGTTSLVLMDERVSPHSFMDFIFVSREDYHKGLINDQILEHEKAHLKQFHSIDVLFVELVKVILWFNPAIYLYRRALLINHEFSADDQVIRESNEPDSYRKSLLKAAEGHLTVKLASNLNFFLTKERFKMMTRQVSRWRHVSTKVLLMPVLPLLFLMYGLFVIDLETEQWIRTPDVELTADTLQIFDQAYQLKFKDEKGQYYTGSQKFFHIRTGMLTEETWYVNGIPIEHRVYNKLGGTFTRNIHEVEDGWTRRINSYFNGTLMAQHLLPHPNYGPEGKTQYYHEEGWLRYESNYLQDSQNFHGLVTTYNEQGEILKQERYENGEPAEKIR